MFPAFIVKKKKPCIVMWICVVDKYSYGGESKKILDPHMILDLLVELGMESSYTSSRH